jgi:predicted nucleic acid-binding protein
VSSGIRRLAVDTSVAVPLVSKAHAAQRHISDWAQGRQLYLSGHAAIETYSVLTRLPGGLAVSAEQAAQLIAETFAGVLSLSAEAASAAHVEMARVGITGGAAYDALVALAAKSHNAALVTRDQRARGTYEVLGVDVLAIGAS